MDVTVKSLEMIQRDFEIIRREADKMKSVDANGKRKVSCLQVVKYWSRYLSSSYKVSEVLGLAREAEEAIRKYSETRSALEASLSRFFKATQQLLDNPLGAVGAEPARYYAIQLTLSVICRAVLATRRGLDELKRLGYRRAGVLAVNISIVDRRVASVINLKGLDISSLYSEVQKICSQVEQWAKSTPIRYLSVTIDKDNILETCDSVRAIFEADVKKLYEVATKAVIDIHSRGFKPPG